MRRLAATACAFLLVSSSGCATLVYPRRSALPEDMRGGIDWSMFQLDVMFTGGIGLLIDFIHGTIYQPLKGYRGRGTDAGLFAPAPALSDRRPASP
jgi:hypothetical protein